MKRTVAYAALVFALNGCDCGGQFHVEDGGDGPDSGSDASLALDGGSDAGPPALDSGFDAGPEDACFGAISGGKVHTCGVTPAGTLWCWGRSSDGRLGDGCTGTECPSGPRQVQPPTDWTLIAAGGGHSCGIRTGELWCWGTNAAGQVGIGEATPAVTTATRVGAETDWTHVALGSTDGFVHTSFSCGIRSGELWCWGGGRLGRTGTCPDGCSSPTRVEAAVDWQSVALGGEHACGVRGDGSLWCWGSNTNGQIGWPTAPNQEAPVQVGVATNWAEVYASNDSTCAIKDDRTLWCWGLNTTGQLGLGVVDANRDQPARVEGEGWLDVAMGDQHACGLRGTELYCWGRNEEGQLGQGDRDIRSMPTRVPGEWTGIGAGTNHTLGLQSDSVFGWGDNGFDQLSSGAATLLVPTLVSCPALE